MKEIVFDKEARERLYRGISTLGKAVGSTMGPNGSTVIIPSDKEFGKYIITKDGVSVAKTIHFEDVVENIGAELVKQAAEKTVEEAGDGTTTATVLATAFIENLKDFPSNDINKAFDEIIPKVLLELKNNSKSLKREDIKHVASISANNDVQIGNTIQQAFDFADIVKVEESNNLEDKLELIDGMSLQTSYISKHFITNPKKGECELEDPRVLILDGKLDNLKSFEYIFKSCAENNESLLIITEHVHENVLRLLETNVLSGAIKLAVIKSPGFSTHRKDLLRDISDFTGSTVINDLSKNYTLSVTGKLKSCKVSKSVSVLLRHPDVNVDEIIENFKELLTSPELEEYDKELLQQRIENLTGKIAIIKVGGKSELEMKERFDRYDDAIKATQCALEEGIVEGGGYALIKATIPFRTVSSTAIEETILDSLQKPYCTIFKENNLVIEDGVEIYTFDLSRNMFNDNIVDPLKVTRCALENAVSVAKIILSTNVIVIHQSEWKN